MKKIFTKTSKLLILLIVLSVFILMFFTNGTLAFNTTEELDEIENFDITIECRSTDNPSSRSLWQNIPEIGGKEFYIKNMLTGQYLDVQGGVGANGTNVWQYKYNGTQAQKWFIYSYGDGTYAIYTALSNDGTYEYGLDVSNGSSTNGTNVQIWTYYGTEAQKFSIGLTNYNTYVFFTQCSNYQSAIVLNGPTCDEGRNVDQYTFQGHANEAWILEPVVRDVDLGASYAMTNYNQYVSAYPNLTTFSSGTVDCANFVSQCLLASGVHYSGDWKVYRKNFNYSQPTNVRQLDNTWELCQPNSSPWTSAAQFKTYWYSRVLINPRAYKASYILAHANEVYNEPYCIGDVIQIANNTLGFLGTAQHTMFITSYGSYNNQYNFELTYHSNPQINKNLLQICQEYRNSGEDPYFIFYHI